MTRPKITWSFHPLTFGVWIVVTSLGVFGFCAFAEYKMAAAFFVGSLLGSIRVEEQR